MGTSKAVTGVPFEGRLLPESPTIEDVRGVLRDHVAIVVSIMAHIADRYERTPYPGLIDTKFNIATGEEYPIDDIRGPNTVYGWIQGRALEALVGHIEWLKKHPWAEPTGTLVPRLEHMLREVYAKVKSMRARNDGRLFFFMDPTGEPFTFSPDGRRVPHDLGAHSPYNFSDLFGSRGLLAAALYLNDTEALTDITRYCLAVEDAIWAKTFRSDQQKLPPYDPTLPAQPERFSHAPYTIQLATPALMALHSRDTGDIERGLRLMEHVMSLHVNTDGRVPELLPYDFWEFVDGRGEPVIVDGELLSDPGHSLEFVGLGMKLTRIARKIGMDPERFADLEEKMHGILQRSFQNGFVPETGGIYKGIDLFSKEPIDATMPWWSLPETMRSAIECWAVGDGEQRSRALAVFAACHNSFVSHYVLPERYLFAVQTRHGATGEVVNVVPATADADPGYHTGLSLIDVLEVVEEETGPFEPAMG